MKSLIFMSLNVSPKVFRSRCRIKLFCCFPLSALSEHQACLREVSVSYYSLKHESWYHFQLQQPAGFFSQTLHTHTHSERNNTASRAVSHTRSQTDHHESHERVEVKQRSSEQSEQAAARPSGSLEFVLIVQMWSWSLTGIVRLKHVTPADWDPKQHLSVCSSADNTACVCVALWFSCSLSSSTHKGYFILVISILNHSVCVVINLVCEAGALLVISSSRLSRTPLIQCVSVISAPALSSV